MIATLPTSTHLLPEERLWKAVLWRAFDDCTYEGYERTLIVAKDEAIKWFRKQAYDFILVCGFSNYEPSYIIRQYHKLHALGKIKYKEEHRKYLRQRKKYLNDRRRQQGL